MQKTPSEQDENGKLDERSAEDIPVIKVTECSEPSSPIHSPAVGDNPNSQRKGRLFDNYESLRRERRRSIEQYQVQAKLTEATLTHHPQLMMSTFHRQWVEGTDAASTKVVEDIRPQERHIPPSAFLTIPTQPYC